MTIKTPEQIANDLYWSGAFTTPLEGKGAEIRRVMAQAIEADRAQRDDALDRVRAVLNAEIGWETPAVLKDRIEWALNGEDA